MAFRAASRVFPPACGDDMTLYLSRITLSRNPAVTALKALIDPCEEAARDRLHDPARGRIMDAHHRLIWALFADDADQRRDFLWRSEGDGRFLTLSHRPPAADGAGLFLPPEVKPFAPDLRAGDRLRFVLRANATQTRKTGQTTRNGKERRVHIDLVMDRLHSLPGQKALPTGVISERPAQRHTLATEAARAWMAGQGSRNGFELVHRETDHGNEPCLDVADYSVVPLPAHIGDRKGQPQFGVIEMAGCLAVTDPDAFLAQLARGFGRAKAFGCGLMLVRRA